MIIFFFVDGNVMVMICSYFKFDYMGCKFCIIKKNWYIEIDIKLRDKVDCEIFFFSY